MTMMSDVSPDLMEEILSRVPITSLGAVRSTCKQWSDLSKNQSFAKKAAKAMVIMIYDSRACLLSVNLHGTHKDLVDPPIKQIGRLNQVDISKVFHCDGLLLCILRDNSRLVAWNPYLGQTRWIKPKNNFHKLDRYGIGYDKNNNHKILRFLDHREHSFLNPSISECEIYDLKSNSWRVLDVTLDWYVLHYRQSVSLKGNTYFVACKRSGMVRIVLIYFDFTSEGFGPCLHLPFQSFIGDDLTLSTVREEQLVVLLNRMNTYGIEIWITTKIETNVVSWSNFLLVDKIPSPWRGRYLYGSFFVDEKRKVALIVEEKHCVALIFDRDRQKETNYKAYMIGENQCYREVDLGESICFPHECSYVPSSVHI